MLVSAVIGDPDAALVRGLTEGDGERAMGELYDRYAMRIHALGLRLLSDRALAEEMVQETFVRLWRSAPRFDADRGSGQGFVFTLARRAAIDMHRRRPDAAAPLPPELAGDDTAFDHLVEELTLREAMHELPRHHREVLELGYFEDLTQEAIGKRLGIPAGTVKSRTYHALRALRGLLETREVEPA